MQAPRFISWGKVTGHWSPVKIGYRGSIMSEQDLGSSWSHVTYNLEIDQEVQ